ncbi:MAG TPA: cytochrome C oxidase subunit IV family protein [Pseudolabrys sp.]|nr:cytochrome C oxidase subunit IV family protein [Pseudolabrys sp.]
MSMESAQSRRQEILQLWKLPVAIWAALMVLLALTVGSAFVPLGTFNIAINLAIACIKATLVALFFMKLNRSSSLLRLAAVAGLFWFILMFLLTGGDYLTR